jgi:hypothetical protein
VATKHEQDELAKEELEKPPTGADGIATIAPDEPLSP